MFCAKRRRHQVAQPSKWVLEWVTVDQEGIPSGDISETLWAMVDARDEADEIWARVIRQETNHYQGQTDEEVMDDYDIQLHWQVWPDEATAETALNFWTDVNDTLPDVSTQEFYACARIRALEPEESLDNRGTQRI